MTKKEPQSSCSGIYPEKTLLLYPPHAVIASLILMFILNFLSLKPFLPCSPKFLALIGCAVSVFGIYLFFTSAMLFRKAETQLTPFKESTTLITSGFFQYSRNPIYLGMILILLGVSISLNKLIIFIIPITFAFWIHFSFILKEEVMMREVYGDKYLEYSKKVRRWL